MEWDTNQLWRKQAERRLNEIGALVKGNQSFTSDRIADLIEQLDELRTELKRISDRQDKMAEYIKAKLKNGGNDG